MDKIRKGTPGITPGVFPLYTEYQTVNKKFANFSFLVYTTIQSEKK